MRDYAESTRRLAELAIRFGANLQPGQILGVTANTGMEDLSRAVAHAAYERGARWVDVIYYDPWVKRERIALAPEATLGDVPPWMVDRLEWLSEQHAARVTLAGPVAPDALDGLDPARVGRDLIPYLPNSGAVVNRRTTNWCVVPAPTIGLAKLVYPDLADEEAYAQLWDAVEHVCRLDEEDPVQAWLERVERLSSVAARISALRLDAIRLRGPGTDLTIGLLPSSEWLAANLETVDGLRHFPNIPTEEVFTTPDPTRTHGYVSTSMPKELYGAIIDGIRLEFEGGVVTRADAERGADAIRSVIGKDDGAARLGEIALVDRDGRIGPLRTVFFETLLDENAASHMALGHGLEFAVGDESDRAKVNASGVHVDLMIGRPELDVDGITAAGEAVPLLRGGTWQL
jgi:aminopeptidase